MYIIVPRLRTANRIPKCRIVCFFQQDEQILVQIKKCRTISRCYHKLFPNSLLTRTKEFLVRRMPFLFDAHNSHRVNLLRLYPKLVYSPKESNVLFVFFFCFLANNLPLTDNRPSSGEPLLFALECFSCVSHFQFGYLFSSCLKRSPLTPCYPWFEYKDLIIKKNSCVL